MKVFTSKEMIEKLKWLVNEVPNYYYSANGTWCNYNWGIGKFMMDCVVSIKGLLWGFIADKNAPHGGGDYGSNGVRDFGANQGIDFCNNASQDFSKVKAGEYLCMAGTQYNHAGMCITPATANKRGTAFECTTSWGVYRCVISEFDIYGNRYYDGVKNVPWTWHGELEYIDYSDSPTPTPTPTPTKYQIGDVVNINGVYVSSTSTEKLTPAITTGTITRIIEGANNPYLLDDGNIGWVNDGCIVGDTPTPQPTVDILDLVRRTIRGDFGNGDARRQALGENYDEVQRQVNLNYEYGTTRWDDVRLY